MPEQLVSSGGFLAPQFLDTSTTFTLTYSVRWPWRRWWLRRNGWSTEWTVEYDKIPLYKAIPTFTAVRGGMTFDA